MRFAITCALLLLMTSCAATHDYNYTNTLQSWRGSSSRSLLAAWGTPSQTIVMPNGKTSYVYVTETDEPFPSQETVQNIFVVENKHANVAIATPNAQPQTAKLYCTTTFEADRGGVIVSAKYSGGNCQAGNLARPSNH